MQKYYRFMLVSHMDPYYLAKIRDRLTDDTKAALRNIHDSNGNTLLHLAVLKNDPVLITQLLDLELHFQKANNAGLTPVELGIFHRCYEGLSAVAGCPYAVLKPRIFNWLARDTSDGALQFTQQILHNFSCSGVIQSSTNSPLLDAIENQNLRMVALLLQHFPQLITCSDRRGNKPIHLMASYCPDTLKIVLQDFKFTHDEYYQAMKILAKAGNSKAF